MDVLAITGAVLAFTAVILGNSMEGGQFAALLDLPAFIIVIGGTLGATLLQTPWRRFGRAFRMVVWVVVPPEIDLVGEVERISNWSRISRREGLLGLENIADKVQEPLRRKGLELLIDGADPHTLRRLMEADCQQRIDADFAAAQVFRSMGGYAPTIGRLGAVIGLIQVLGNLADPEELGQGIATAFVATIYGVGFANLLFLPVADRLRSITIRNAELDSVYVEGLLAIAEGEHPKSIETRLVGAMA